MAVPAAMRKLLGARPEDDPLRFSREYLLEEARQGIRTGVPPEVAWFPFELLPPCAWAGGGAVEPDLIRWWVTVAWAFNQPAGTPLLKRYLMLLDTSSREALGLFLLKTFIRQQPPAPDLAGAPANVQAFDRRRLASDRDWRILRAKGVLAVAAGAPEAELVGLIRTYFREHPSHWADLKVLLEVLGAAGTWSATRFLAGVPRMSHLPSVQKAARILVEQIAQAQGWSREELDSAEQEGSGHAGNPN